MWLDYFKNLLIDSVDDFIVNTFLSQQSFVFFLEWSSQLLVRNYSIIKISLSPVPHSVNSNQTTQICETRNEHQLWALRRFRTWGNRAERQQKHCQAVPYLKEMCNFRKFYRYFQVGIFYMQLQNITASNVPGMQATVVEVNTRNSIWLAFWEMEIMGYPVHRQSTRPSLKPLKESSPSIAMQLVDSLIRLSRGIFSRVGCQNLIDTSCQCHSGA